MRAYLITVACLATATSVSIPSSRAAEYRSANFLVSAPTASLARRVAEAAEANRKAQAEEWLGEELPQWRELCPIRVSVGRQYRPSGNTSFVFRQRTPGAWRMSVQGTEQDILDSVLPHEVMHTVLATRFGGPLPRWADEGICVMVEDAAVHAKLDARLKQDAQAKRTLPVERLLSIDEYPANVLMFYAQGFSMTRFLIEAGGKQKFVQFLDEGIQEREWIGPIQRHYGYSDFRQLSAAWHDDSPADDRETVRTILVTTEK